MLSSLLYFIVSHWQCGCCQPHCFKFIFNAKECCSNGDAVMNPLLSQSERQLSNYVWFYKPYLVESYYGWVVELVESYYGCRVLTPVMIWVKSRSNLQVQLEKWDSIKRMVWESQFAITIEYPRHVLTFTWAKCPMTGVPQKEPAQPHPLCHQTLPSNSCQNQGLEKAKQKRSILFCAGLWLRQEIETAIICPWEEMPFWQRCSYIDPLALSRGRTTWLQVVIDRRGRLQALCFFYLEKYAGTIFYLCGTSKGRAGERGEGGSREMENSRRAGFSLPRYANKASEHESETELINLILISWEGSFLPTWQHIHALQWRQITLCEWESCQFIFITYLPPHHQHMIVWQLNNA